MMKITRLITLALSVSGLWISPMALAEPVIEIAPVAAPVADLSIPWVDVGDTAWQSGAPMISATGEGGLGLHGWLAADERHLLVRLEVADPVHLNARSGEEIWDGDFVRIAIDGHGDRSRGGDVEAEGLFGPDDTSIGFALTPAGPQGWTYATQIEPFRGEYPADLLRFSRDEGARCTRYDIRIPWERVSTTPGALPIFGIVLQARSVNAPGDPPAHVRWGDGANEPRPGLFKTIALKNVSGTVAAATVLREQIWSSTDAAEVLVAAPANGKHAVVASAGERRTEHPVPASESGVAYLFVRYVPEEASPEPLRVEVAGTSVSAEVLPVVAGKKLDALTRRLDELLVASPHPLFTRHLRSLKAMAAEEWARAALYAHANPALANETLTYLIQMEEGLRGDAADWDLYASGQRPLYFAYLSPRDGTPQWYELSLPKGWDASKSREEQPAYPMYFELHGAGNPHYLSRAARRTSEPTGPAVWEGYHVHPFGRGNSGYRDIGEIDVWEAYEDAHANFKIDPDRRYLFGFSMGGAGTWNLGSRTPDRWAAIAILGMGPNAGADVGLARNVSYLPVYIWAGEEDNIAFRGRMTVKEQIAAFAEELRKHGNDPVAVSSPGVGHEYLAEKQEESRAFLSKHVRRRPNEFAYVSDTNEHRGVWGIEMTRDLTVSGLPSFKCAIDGRTVRIDSEGTPGLTVDLGEAGLRMEGDVTVIWNGREAHKGPATEAIELGTPRRSWRRR